jgi:hypothetical protein
MWSEGIIESPITGVRYTYCIKHFSVGSEYGIDGGRISKLSIREFGGSRHLCNYDRGWDKKPADDVKAVYDIIIDLYN